MILAIGEILVDLLENNNYGEKTFKAFCGGAPFNFAVNAKSAGAKVGFIGRVGDDSFGKFIILETHKVKFDYLNLQVDESKNTALSFVSLTNGERDFEIYQQKTADYNIKLNNIDFNNFEDLNIVHLGSLMLSKIRGRILAKRIVKKAKKANKLLSFDLNYRADLFKKRKKTKNIYKYFINNTDIIKFSETELIEYTGINNIEKAIKSIYKMNKLYLVTLGDKGSYYFFNGLSNTIPTIKIKSIDNTGAGDSFFGTFIANIDGKILNKNIIENAMVKANLSGAKTTQFFGAVNI